MGLIGRIAKSFLEEELREIATEIYEGYYREARQIAPPGIDANPLPDDQGVMITLDGSSGKGVHVGVYPDPQAEPGEVRFYSRDAQGALKAVLWLKKDGKHYFNDGSKSAARKDDKIDSDSNDDSEFWNWITAVHTALQSSPANGTVAAPKPTKLTGKIIEGTDEVQLP